MKRPAPNRQARGPKKAKSAPIDFGRVQQNFQQVITHAFRGQSHEFNRLLGITLALLVIGLVMVLDASYVTDVAIGKNPFATFGKQLLIGAAGLVGLTIFSLASTDLLVRISRYFFLGAVGLQIITQLFGVTINGNKNWISLGFLGNFQPSEILKIAMLLQVALMLSEHANGYGFKERFRPAVIPAGVAIFMVAVGKDMGTVLVMAALVLAQLFMAGLEKKHLYWALAVGGAAALYFTKQSPNRWARTIAWANPYAPDPGDVNWQAKHGIWALAAGGFGGVGFGKSTMKWSWIPEVDNDFIFAIIGEEFGFIGAAVVIFLFVWLAVILIRIIQKTDDLFGKLLVTGVMGWLIFQALVNIAVVLSMLPVLGVPLPMISSGGSSLLANLVAIGIVLSVERQNSSGRALVRRRR